jgi:acetyl-CoA carboxylase carboxyltransferase component
VLGGSLGEVYGEKIVKVMDHAMKTGIPVVGINDGGGARIQEGVVALGLFAEIFFRNVRSSGVIPWRNSAAPAPTRPGPGSRTTRPPTSRTQEWAGIIRRGTKLLYAYAEATVPKVTVMGAQGAVNILYRRDLAASSDPDALRAQRTQEYEDTLANPYAAAERGYIDAVIRPAETRTAVTRALLSLRTKRETRPRSTATSRSRAGPHLARASTG